MIFKIVKSRRTNTSYRFLSSIFITIFIFTSSAISSAAVLPYMPAANKIISTSGNYDLPRLVGLKFSSDNPFEFTFLLDKGTSPATKETMSQEVANIGKYFLGALTIPEKDLWVNLSPYEKNRISPDALALTDLGKDMLGEDYVLKQLVSSVTYPESESGRKFWDSVYKKIQEKLGTANIPVGTFNKVWIVPEKIRIIETNDTVVLKEAKLKVLMEEDYLAISQNAKGNPQRTPLEGRNKNDAITDKVSSQAMRETIIPIIEDEVNNGKNFAHLRQIYNSIIMAAWFKEKLTNSILAQVYFDKKKIKGAEADDPQVREKIFNEYTKAFREGVYNYIRKDRLPGSMKIVKRQYVSGGVTMPVTGPDGLGNPQAREVVSPAVIAEVWDKKHQGGATEPQEKLIALDSAGKDIPDATGTSGTAADNYIKNRILPALVAYLDRLGVKDPANNPFTLVLAQRAYAAQRAARGVEPVQPVSLDGIDPAIIAKIDPWVVATVDQGGTNDNGGNGDYGTSGAIFRMTSKERAALDAKSKVAMEGWMSAQAQNWASTMNDLNTMRNQIDNGMRIFSDRISSLADAQIISDPFRLVRSTANTYDFDVYLGLMGKTDLKRMTREGAIRAVLSRAAQDHLFRQRLYIKLGFLTDVTSDSAATNIEGEVSKPLPFGAAMNALDKKLGIGEIEESETFFNALYALDQNRRSDKNRTTIEAVYCYMGKNGPVFVQDKMLAPTGSVVFAINAYRNGTLYDFYQIAPDTNNSIVPPALLLAIEHVNTNGDYHVDFAKETERAKAKLPFANAKPAIREWVFYNAINEAQAGIELMQLKTLADSACSEADRDAFISQGDTFEETLERKLVFIRTIRAWANVNKRNADQPASQIPHLTKGDLDLIWTAHKVNNTRAFLDGYSPLTGWFDPAKSTYKSADIEAKKAILRTSTQGKKFSEEAISEFLRCGAAGDNLNMQKIENFFRRQIGLGRVEIVPEYGMIAVTGPKGDVYEFNVLADPDATAQAGKKAYELWGEEPQSPDLAKVSYPHIPSIVEDQDHGGQDGVVAKTADASESYSDKIVRKFIYDQKESGRIFAEGPRGIGVKMRDGSVIVFAADELELAYLAAAEEWGIQSLDGDHLIWRLRERYRYVAERSKPPLNAPAYPQVKAPLTTHDVERLSHRIQIQYEQIMPEVEKMLAEKGIALSRLDLQVLAARIYKARVAAGETMPVTPITLAGSGINPDLLKGVDLTELTKAGMGTVLGETHDDYATVPLPSTKNKGGLDFGNSAQTTAIERDKNGVVLSGNKAAAYLLSGKVAGFRLALLKLTL